MSTRREKLIQTARNLFYKNGFRATGIDQILAEAGVSKPTMYKYFRSKDELIIESLKTWDHDFRLNLSTYVEEHAATSSERVVRVFDFLQSWFESEQYSGCLSIKASVEFPEKGNAIHQVAAEQKNGLQAYLEKLASEKGVENAAAMARQLLILVEGAIVTSQMTNTSTPAKIAKDMALHLLDRTADTVAA